VLSEAERLGLSIPGAPGKLHIGKLTGKIGDVPLTPEQQNKFAETAGKLAHQIMTPLVASPCMGHNEGCGEEDDLQKVFAVRVRWAQQWLSLVRTALHSLKG